LFWANAPKATMLRQRVSSVFIGAAMFQLRDSITWTCLYPKEPRNESS
jgi:hypothetical protein